MTLKVATIDRNRKHIGSLIRKKRMDIGMTQKALSDLLGLQYYTFISQVETGWATLPPTLWIPMADALRLDRQEFTVSCLAYLQPEIYQALFGKAARTKAVQVLQSL